MLLREREGHVDPLARYVVGIGLVIVAMALPAWAQGASPVYYAAQLGGGSIAALAGSLVGTLAGGLSAGDGTPIGFGLGASVGATWGVVQVAS